MLRKISFALLAMFLIAVGTAPSFAVSLFSNPGFEMPSPPSGKVIRFIPFGTQSGGWLTTHPQSQWCSSCRPLEFWSNSTQNITPAEGVQFIELDVDVSSMVYQQIALATGDTLKWSFLHRGRGSATNYDVAEFRIGIPTGLPAGSVGSPDPYSIVIAKVSTTNTGSFSIPTGSTFTATPAGNGWVRYSGTYTYTGATQTVNIGYRSVSSADNVDGVGNFLDDAQLEIEHRSGCCDQIEVQPFWVPDVSMEYRRFEIYNVKYPASDICSIDIDIKDSSNQPPISGWQGGGLFVNTIAKPVPAWWKFPYNRIPNGTTITQIDGHATFSAPAVQFNLGIDYSVLYTGTVFLTINHCDGTICELTVRDWTPRPPRRIGGTTSETFNPNLSQKRTGVNVRFDDLKELKGRIKWIGVEVLDADTEVFSVETGNAQNTRGRDNEIRVVSADKQPKVALYKLGTPLDPRNPISGQINLVLTSRERRPGKPRLKYIFFDENASPIGFLTNEGR